MKSIFAILLMLASAATSLADDLMVFKLQGGATVAVKVSGGKMELLGLFDSVTVIESSPTPPPSPVDAPTGPGQLICVRPWSCTLDESDADLTIRESIDAAGSKIPYLRLLPDTVDQRLQPHPAERYRSLVKDPTKAWMFLVRPTATTPRIFQQGPLDEDVALKWIGVPKVAFLGGQANEAPWLDVNFEQQPEFRGAIELPPELNRQALAAAVNVSTLPGFKPIPKAEWPQWAARFPVSRLVKSIRNITEQTMGSCVGHGCGNAVEGGGYMMAGDLFFRRASGMSMYKRIGRSPSSGAYIPDAYDEIFSRGILPVTGQGYPHEFSQDTGWSTPLPSGWEETGRLWKAVVYSVDSEEYAFRLLMDCRLRTQFGRSSHSISGFCVMLSNGKWIWVYENSWGKDWGDFGVSAGYDSRFYSSFVPYPVLRDEIQVLLARELPALRREVGPSPLEAAAKEFHDQIEAIKLLHEATKGGK